MLEAATEHMGARQQAYTDHHLFQHFDFTQHHSDIEFSFYSNAQVYNLRNTISRREETKSSVFQYPYFSLKWLLRTASCADLTELLATK